MRVRSLGVLAVVLLAVPVVAGARQQGAKPDLPAELKVLDADFRKAEAAFFEPYQKAKTDAERERIRLDINKHPARSFLAKYQDLARRAEGTETGAQALLWILRNAQTAGQPKAAEPAIKSLVNGYMDAPVMLQVVQNLRYAGWSVGREPVQTALRTVAEKSKRRDVKGTALFTLACMGMEGPEATPAERAAARKLFDQVKSEYADQPVAKEADAYIFELENLQVGMTAPDFQATDQDGKTFRLSEYRGKVVVLDFWGFW